jgi:hypothetical protein
VHPTSPKQEKISDLKLPAYTLEFPFDTTRAVASLLLNGVFDRYRDVRSQFTHAGGTIPYLLQRLEYTRTRSAEAFPELAKGTPNGVAATLRGNVFYDTALSYSKVTLSALGQFPGYDRVLFGSDFPHAPARYAAEGAQALKEYFEGNEAGLRGHREGQRTPPPFKRRGNNVGRFYRSSLGREREDSSQGICRLDTFPSWGFPVYGGDGRPHEHGIASKRFPQSRS